ncbi:MAG TPA: hypothetical protein VKG65_12555 [Terriglobales bacterium]|nr:hypothetical protein [Terriglobales bacterium]
MPVFILNPMLLARLLFCVSAVVAGNQGRAVSTDMTRTSVAYRSLRRCLLWISFLFLLCAAPAAQAQTCFNGPELDGPAKNAIESAARRYLDMSARGDVAGLKANAIPEIASVFGAIEQAVVTNKEALAGAEPTIAGTYLLDASQAKAALPRANFYCGVYNSADRISFSIPDLPPGRYAIVLQKVYGKEPITLTLILQDMAGTWKLAGYYPRLNSIGGHDGQWYLTKAREFKSKGELHNAWFYYLTAWDLLAPVDFMSTPQLDKIADEMQATRPNDLPNTGAPMSLSASGKVFKVTEITPVPVDNNVALRILHVTPDAANPRLANQDNLAVIKAIVAKYPELRDAFSAVVALAEDDSGHDYGSVLPMKDVK